MSIPATMNPGWTHVRQPLRLTARREPESRQPLSLDSHVVSYTTTPHTNAPDTMKIQPIRSCSCKMCRAGRHCNRRELHRKVRRTARFLNLLTDPDEAQAKSHPAIAGGYTD